MQYNGTGQRSYMAVSVPGVSSGGTTVYEADTGSVSYEYDVEGRLTRDHIVRNAPYDNPFYESPDFQYAWDARGYQSFRRTIPIIWRWTDVGNGDLNYGTFDRLSHLTFHDDGVYRWFGGYRPDGLRAYKWQELNGNPDDKRFFLYDGTRVLCEFDETGALTAAYGYGGHGLVQAKTYGASAVTYSYAFDPQGSPVNRLEGSQPTFYFRFDAFGRKLTVRGSSAITRKEPVGYSGQWGGYTDYTSNSGYELVMMGYRFYSPDGCVFITQDPIGYEGGYNLYAYCDGDPVNRIDSLGLDWSIGPKDHPLMTFSWGDTAEGLKTGLAATAHVMTLGKYDGGRFKNNVGFDGAVGLATVGREVGITAITMGAGEAIQSMRAARALKAAKDAKSSVAVYESVNAAGEVEYVGITNNLLRRFAEHGSKLVNPRAIRGLGNLTRSQARAVEQVLIEHHGLAKNGGTLLNKINSIAKTNPNYAQALKEGAALLRKAGYAGFQ